jgi:hypothetical protein
MNIHRFDDPEGVYTQTQCDEAIRDGDVLIVTNPDGTRSVGFMNSAWPIIVIGDPGECHKIRDGWEHSLMLDYPATFDYIRTYEPGRPDPSSEPVPAPSDPSMLTDEQIIEAVAGRTYRPERRLVGFRWRISWDARGEGGAILAVDKADARNLLTAYTSRVLGEPAATITITKL